jgi:hypothetical protein
VLYPGAAARGEARLFSHSPLAQKEEPVSPSRERGQ